MIKALNTIRVSKPKHQLRVKAMEGTKNTSEGETMNISNKESSKWNFHQGWKFQFQVGEEEVLIHEGSDPPGLWESRTTSQDKHGWNEHFWIWEHKNKSLWCVKNVDEVFKKKQAVSCGSVTYFEFLFPWHSVVQATLSQSAWLQILTPPLRTLYGLGQVTWLLVLQFPQQQNRDTSVPED